MMTDDDDDDDDDNDNDNDDDECNIASDSVFDGIFGILACLRSL